MSPFLFFLILTTHDLHTLKVQQLHTSKSPIGKLTKKIPRLSRGRKIRFFNASVLNWWLWGLVVGGDVLGEHSQRCECSHSQSKSGCGFIFAPHPWLLPPILPFLPILRFCQCESIRPHPVPLFLSLNRHCAPPEYKRKRNRRKKNLPSLILGKAISPSNSHNTL